MKKILTTLALAVAMNFSANAQADFRSFKVDVLLGYAAPTGSNVKGGVAISVEPKINLSDNLSLGVKGEYAALQAVKNTVTNDYSGRSIGSGLVTLEYLLSESVVRVFAGAGAGLYFNGSFDQSNDTTPVHLDSKSNFGFAPRVGIQFGHLRVVGEYNIIPKNNNTVSNDYKYFSLKAGVTLGGGKK